MLLNNKKFLFTIGILFLLLIISFLFYRYMPRNEFLNENDLSYKVTGIPKEIKLGDKIKIKSQITNTSNRSYKIANNGSQIFIFVYKSSEEEPVWTTGLHNVNLYAGIPKKAELEYTFDDTGEYIIKIKSVFSAEYKKKRKDYSIEILSQTINIE